MDPGTWGKADAATMARRKVIKVRRGAGGAPADQQAPAAAAAAADNPFAGVALAPTAANPFAGIAMTASAADQVQVEHPGLMLALRACLCWPWATGTTRRK